MDSIYEKNTKSRWTAVQTSKGEAAITGDVESPFPILANGLTDLRGLVVKRIVKRSKVSLVDLSDAEFGGFAQFSACEVQNTRFRHASLNTNLGNSFRSCDLSSAKLVRAVLRGEFTDCDFTKANLTGAMGSEVRFVRCVFVQTNFKKSTFLHATFEDCQFENCKYGSGSFAYSKFVRSPMEHENLGNTIMDKVSVM